ncbi:MAG: hypothetical protein U9P73_05785 [Candidatus Cloacimonadota bacterium]|nr:hypothetical protein [Candidatus Cloacimonadota bacterium]
MKKLGRNIFEWNYCRIFDIWTIYIKYKLILLISVFNTNLKDN